MGSFSFNMSLFQKYFFYIFNFYLVLRGLCTLIWTTVVYFEVQSLYIVIVPWKKDAEISLEILIGISCILIVFAFCGGLFSVLFFNNTKFRNQSTCNTCGTTVIVSFSFAVVFLIILIVQSTAAIYYLVVVPEDEGVNFKKALNNYIFRWEDRAYVDHIQNRFDCCGYYSYHDYEHMDIIPNSCCYNWKTTCTKNDVILKYGCEYRINTWYNFIVKYRIYLISIFVLIFTAVELISMIVALCLVNSIKRRNKMKHQETCYNSRGSNCNKVFPASS